MSISDFNIGDFSENTKVFQDEDIVKYAQASGDNNPIHMDEAYAKKTRFGGRIVQGMLVSGLISSVLGTKLPGSGTIYLSQNLKFINPVMINDVITARVEITAIDKEKNRLYLKTTCISENGTLVVIGDAVVIPPTL